MKVFVAFSALLAVASASQLYLSPVAPLLLPSVSSQYHSQDTIGQYVYGYNDPLSAKQEVKSLDGVTRGYYSYIDSNNLVQTVDYVADAGGFRAAATNLPKPVEAPIVPSQDVPQQVADTPEVAAAKSVHLAAIEEAKLRSQVYSFPSPVGLPQQVLDTPEVAAAKAAHFAAVEEARKQLGYQFIPIPAPVAELPRPVEDTVEVAAAKAAHFAAIEEAKRQVIAAPVVIELPRPTADTPEVAKAKAEHLIAIEQAKLRNSYQPVVSAPLIVPPQAPLPVLGYAPFPRLGYSYSSIVL